MIGVSIYLSENLEDIRNYLKIVSNFGVKELFTSMHINEEDAKKNLNKLKEISLFIKNHGMDLMIDISSLTLTKYDMTLNELIKYLSEIEVSKLRLDYGFSDEDIAQISKEFNVVLNASTIDDKQCEKLETLGVDLNKITVCHNFYPRPETGLSEKLLLKQNIYLKSKGFKIQAFLAGDEKLRGPIYKGLPTIEIHRNKDPLFVYLELTKKYLVDEVYVGDISISEFSLGRIKEYIDKNTIVLRTKDVKINDERLKNIFWGVHINRKDVSDFVIRSSKTRVIVDFKIKKFNNVERVLGAITIDNEMYGRYNGELQISKKSLISDEKVNVLGYIVNKDLPILEYILSETKFRFI